MARKLGFSLSDANDTRKVRKTTDFKVPSSQMMLLQMTPLEPKFFQSIAAGCLKVQNGQLHALKRWGWWVSSNAKPCPSDRIAINDVFNVEIFKVEMLPNQISALDVKPAVDTPRWTFFMVSKAETEPDAGDKEFPVSYALPGLSAYLTKNTEQAKRPESTDFVPLFHSLPDACHAAFYFTKGGYNTEMILFQLSLPSSAFSEAGLRKKHIFSIAIPELTLMPLPMIFLHV